MFAFRKWFDRLQDHVLGDESRAVVARFEQQEVPDVSGALGHGSSFVHLLQVFEYVGIRKVRVISMRDDQTCRACSAADGREYPIRDARRLHPLPHRDCTSRRCRCEYIPVAD